MSDKPEEGVIEGDAAAVETPTPAPEPELAPVSKASTEEVVKTVEPAFDVVDVLQEVKEVTPASEEPPVSSGGTPPAEPDVSTAPASDPAPPHEQKSAPLAPPPPPEPTPAPPPLPTPPIPPTPPAQPPIASRLGEALEALRFRKRARLEKILQLARKKGTIKNDDVEKLLHVSDSTAQRYLNQLVIQAKLRRSGPPQHAVYESV